MYVYGVNGTIEDFETSFDDDMARVFNGSIDNIIPFNTKKIMYQEVIEVISDIFDTYGVKIKNREAMCAYCTIKLLYDDEFSMREVIKRTKDFVRIVYGKQNLIKVINSFFK